MLEFQKLLIILYLLKLELFLLNILQIINIHINLIDSCIFHLTQNALFIIILLKILKIIIILKWLLEVRILLTVAARILKFVHVLEIIWNLLLLLLHFLIHEFFISLKLLKLKLLIWLLFIMRVKHAWFLKLFKLLEVLVHIFLLRIRLINFKKGGIQHVLLHIPVSFCLIPELVLVMEILLIFIHVSNILKLMGINSWIDFLLCEWLKILIELIHGNILP